MRTRSERELVAAVIRSGKERAFRDHPQSWASNLEVRPTALDFTW